MRGGTVANAAGAEGKIRSKAADDGGGLARGLVHNQRWIGQVLPGAVPAEAAGMDGGERQAGGLDHAALRPGCRRDV